MSAEADILRLKSALRVRIQAKLTGLDPAKGAHFTARIFERVIRLPEFERAQSVLTFVSMAREVGTHNLIRHCLLAGKKVCVPAFDRAQKRYFTVAIEDFDRDLSPGHHGILEPRQLERQDFPHLDPHPRGERKKDSTRRSGSIRRAPPRDRKGEAIAFPLGGEGRVRGIFNHTRAGLAFVPGLAFDNRGNRLGRGKGYFDELLAGFRGVKVALAFDLQVVDSVPATARDVPMDIVVTEERVVRIQHQDV